MFLNEYIVKSPSKRHFHRCNLIYVSLSFFIQFLYEVGKNKVMAVANSFNIFTTSLLLIALLSNHVAFASTNLRDPSVQVVKEEKRRPNIYTFFQMKINKNGKEDTGGKHDVMLQTWKESWAARGWNPIVLNLDDARKHPDFDYYSKKFEDLTPGEAFIFGGSYNYMCLMRWLAMAAQNTDAWMSDYDTYPMHIRKGDGLYLPNNGKFTVYERFVPSLMSASATEWNTVAIQVIEQVLHKLSSEGSQTKYSDMYALEDLWVNAHKDAKPYNAQRQVDSYPYSELGKVDCERASHMLAMHLAHAHTTTAKNAGLIKDSIADEDRSVYARIIMDDWREQCSPNRATAK